MPAPATIAPDKLAKLKLLGTARCLNDNRRDPVRAEHPRLFPGARALTDADMAPDALDRLTDTLSGRIVAICAEGHGRSQGISALLRIRGIAAEYLGGGCAAWRAARLPSVDPGKITARDGQGRSVWVIRARPIVDRIACPWLIRRFVDPRAVFLYVAPAEIASVAETYGAMPFFDVEDTFWSHRGELCTLDVMLAELGLRTRGSIGSPP
jgi:hypothetical protein